VPTSSILHSGKHVDYRELAWKGRSLTAAFVLQCDDKAHPVRNGPFLTPCDDDPPCAYCHMKLSSCRPKCPDCKAPCRRCGALRMRLYDLPERGFSDEKLRPPMVSMVRRFGSMIVALSWPDANVVFAADRFHARVGAFDSDRCFR